MIEVLTRDEQAQILFRALQDSPRDYAILMTMLQTGIRVGELVGLIFEDVLIGGNFKNSLSVRAEISKTGEEREIPISKKLKDVLQEYLNWLEPRKVVIAPDAPLFQQMNRQEKLSTRQIERIVADLSKKSIGRRIHPHILRHTFATNMMRLADIRIVQTILGHKSIASTQIYTHPNNQDLAQAVEKLN